MTVTRRFPPDLLDGLALRRHCLLVALAWTLSSDRAGDAESLPAALGALPPDLLGPTQLATTLGGTLLTLQDLGLLSDVHPAGDGWWVGCSQEAAA